MPSLISPGFLLPLFLLTFIPFVCYSQAATTTSPFLTYCSGTNYDSPSLYESHLGGLLALLINSTPSSLTLYTASTYPNSSSPQVFGLAQCRPDASVSLCTSCLNQSAILATANSTGGCGNRKSAALRYDYCLLRYSDQPFYGFIERRITVYSGMEAKNASKTFSFMVDYFMNSNLIESASASNIKFSVGISNSSVEPRRLYCMAWCTLDLERDGDCKHCLDAAMAALVPGKERGRVATVSCEVRFEPYKFFSTMLFPKLIAASPPKSTEAEAPISLPHESSSEVKGGSKTKYIAAASGAVALLLFITTFFLLFRCWKRQSVKVKPRLSEYEGVDEEKLVDTGIIVFDLSTIKYATNSFAHENKLGQGGFGPVYKGVLPDEQQIAVKRLSTNSGQGLEEMKNEIDFIAKLQHKNLVRLLGYCLEEDEKILVYEFLPNTSLDKFISDPTRRTHLDWGTRVKIMIGIGRGIRYLHEDSRLRIVHRDLKASNILLDSNMNPKISDFGLAKIFGADETERNTSQIAGTFGYMAPEYILHGIFSTKSDVFSYGVMVLEIITGEKESSFMEESEDDADLLSYVWKHWIQGKALQVVDKSLAGQYSSHEAMRSIQIGLLCVQQEQVHRPNMASVIAMLSTLSMRLPTPSPPAFCGENNLSSKSKASIRIKEIQRPNGPLEINASINET